MVRIILVIFALAFPTWTILKKKPDCNLTIYTYSSFTSSWGAGPILQKMFQDKHKCNLTFEDVGDARTILQHIKREIDIKSKTDADVVLGLDQYSIGEAKNIIEWENINELKTDFEFFKNENLFVAFDWAPLVFISNSKENINSIDEILNHKYSLMEPRSSSPGFQFLIWTFDVLGKDIVVKFKENAHTISPSWSSAYGLFTKKETDIAFTYLTSLAYHWKNNETEYKLVEIDKPHPYQVEFLGLPAQSKKKDIGKLFINFILSKEIQKVVMDNNYMLPVIPSVVEGTVFDNLPSLQLVDYADKSKETFNPEPYIDFWKSI